MTIAQPNPETGTSPVEAVVERMNDPAVAASLVTLLDNAELLSTLVLGLSGFVARGDTIMDAVAEGVNDFKTSGGADGAAELPSVSDMTAAAGQLAASAPFLADVLGSAIARPETIELLATLSEAATEGAANAQVNETTVAGIRGAVRAFRDPDVQRGLGLLVEIARSLGRKMA